MPLNKYPSSCRDKLFTKSFRTTHRTALAYARLHSEFLIIETPHIQTHHTAHWFYWCNFACVRSRSRSLDVRNTHQKAMTLPVAAVAKNNITSCYFVVASENFRVTISKAQNEENIAREMEFVDQTKRRIIIIFIARYKWVYYYILFAICRNFIKLNFIHVCVVVHGFVHSTDVKYRCGMCVRRFSASIIINAFNAMHTTELLHIHASIHPRILYFYI